MRSKGKLFFLLLIFIFLIFPTVYAWEIDKTSRVTEVIDGNKTERDIRTSDLKGAIEKLELMEEWATHAFEQLGRYNAGI